MISQLVSPAETSFAAVVEQAPGSFLCIAQSFDEDHLLIDSSAETSIVSINCYCEHFDLSVARALRQVFLRFCLVQLITCDWLGVVYSR